MTTKNEAVTCAFRCGSTIYVAPGQNAAAVLQAHGWPHDTHGIYCGARCQSLAAQHRAREPHEHALDASGNPREERLRRVEVAQASGASRFHETAAAVDEVELCCAGPECGGRDPRVGPARLRAPRAKLVPFVEAHGWEVANGLAFCSRRCAMLRRMAEEAQEPPRPVGASPFAPHPANAMAGKGASGTKRGR